MRDLFLIGFLLAMTVLGLRRPFLLVCMGVQFVINGILEIVHQLMAGQ